nr:MAG TPA: hypothetical protein [Caudoviricetes sp.]
MGWASRKGCRLTASTISPISSPARKNQTG